MHLRSRDASLTGWLVLLLALGAAEARGQVDVSQWPKVQLEVLVTGAKGDPVAGLDAGGITVREDGRPQTVQGLEAVSEPQSVCMLVDTSGSMYSRMAEVRAAANHLLAILPAEDQVCLASFSWHLEIRRHFTKDHDKIAASIGALNAEGGTSLHDALAGLEDFMRGAAKDRGRAIILFTDGADNASNADEEQMRRAMESAGSPVVHVVRIPPAHGDTVYRSEEASEKGAVERIAAISGGLSYFPGDVREMNASLDDLNRSMKSVYRLTYSTDRQPRDGRERRLEIKLDKAHGGAKAVVSAPERFYAPAE